MKIAMFTDTFYPKNDGISTSTQHLAASLVRQGHQVLIVAPKVHFRTSKFSIPGVQIVWLGSIPAGFYPDLRLASWSPAMHKALNDFGPEVVHVMSPMPVSLTGIAYAKLHHLPIVMTFHTYFMDPEYLKVIKIDKTSKFVEELGWDLAKTVHSRADLTIAPTEYVAADLRERDFKEPILVIPSGVEIKKDPIDQEKVEILRKKYHLNDKRVVVTIGRVSCEKNLRGLIRIFLRVQAVVPEAHLVVVGAGPDLKAIKDFAREMKINDHITFVGDVPHQKVLSDGYYELGEFFTTASLSETQGMTSVEAQLCGLPVVAYESKGLPFVVGQAGILIKEDDEHAMAAAMVDLLGHREKLTALRRQIPKNLHRFDINQTTKKIVTAYKRAGKINACRTEMNA